MVEIILLWYNDTNLHSSYIFHSVKQIKFDKISEQQRVNIIKMIKICASKFFCQYRHKKRALYFKCNNVKI